ncbi:GTP pyrophosphokinase [Alphaproteobacteria bacterium]|nr:GTP pyrophosphokinase [Alphaproteobacteria bacterium]GHS98239.1 GTP pyrophosphokinase [Alphaproteobacteria bacterium]
MYRPMLRQFELVDIVRSYDPGTDENLLNKAYVFSLKAHGVQRRESGDPFFSHPVEVAGILTRFKFDHLTIAAALLHDTIEDTVATLNEIQTEFGLEVAYVVDGVTKLSKLDLKSEDTKQAENFRKLVLAMANDIRVLFVKLADRQHNMQTLHYIKDPHKRQKIAKETLDIYAPLASRVGVQKMKETLEDFAFREINPQAYETTHKRLEFLCDSLAQPLEDIEADLEALLKKTGVHARVFGRLKTPYSIWKKIMTQNTTFEQLCDILAFRVVVPSLAECYQALGVLHSEYWVVPGRFKDYISTPKVNNYQSLHTAVISPKYQRMEIQIRTEEMELEAEYGIAAHWQYKQNVKAHDGKKYLWIRSLLQIMEQANNPEEFLENTKLEMFQEQVFCFSERGELIVLPKDVTPIDFAYAVDSWLGDHISEVKINGKSMPLRTVLQNGDQIQIITSEDQMPLPVWEKFVRTGKARTHIRQFIRAQQKKKMIQRGKEKLAAALGLKKEKIKEPALTPLLSTFSCSTLADFYEALGEDILDVAEVAQTLHKKKF